MKPKPCQLRCHIGSNNFKNFIYGASKVWNIFQAPSHVRAKAKRRVSKSEMAQNQLVNTGRMMLGDRLSLDTKPTPCSHQKFGAKIKQRNEIMWFSFFNI
jgi:hypothetical protein